LTCPKAAAATHAQLLLTRRRRRRAKGTARPLSICAKSAWRQAAVRLSRRPLLLLAWW